jgi:hypothetical protein
MVQGALVCGETANSIRRELTSRRVAGETAIRQRFERARAETDLPVDSDSPDLASYVVTVIRGMAVQGAGGATREEPRRVADRDSAEDWASCCLPCVLLRQTVQTNELKEHPVDVER